MASIIEKNQKSDFTIVLVTRIDSLERIENIRSITKYITKYFTANIIFCEVGTKPLYTPKLLSENVKYKFVYEDSHFNLAGLYNKLLLNIQTPYVTIWDADFIVPQIQYLDAVNKAKENKAIICLPHDGTTYLLDKMSTHLFRSTINCDLLKKIEHKLPLIYRNQFTGSILIINKELYLKAGGENENIFGWGIGDPERLKRLERLDIREDRISGPLYKLWSGVNKRIPQETELHNLAEYFKIIKN